MLHGVVATLDRRRTAPMADRGTVMNVVSWLLLVVTVFTVVTRFAMKMIVGKKGRRFALDDVFIILALVSGRDSGCDACTNPHSCSVLDKPLQCLWSLSMRWDSTSLIYRGVR
jgi:hypothetical protein